MELGRLRRYDYKYYILCPILLNGMALIGCPDKFITCSGKLLININATKDSLNFTVEYTKDKVVKLLFYSEKRPTSIQDNNNLLNTWDYDKVMNKIELNLKFEKYCKKDISIYL